MSALLLRVYMFTELIESLKSREIGVFVASLAQNGHGNDDGPGRPV